MHLSQKNISFDLLHSPLLKEKKVKLTVVRLDKLHSQVSGNKLFKLHFFLEDCLKSAHKTIVTFGGAFSNHLVATAWICKEKNISCIGIVRGEEPAVWSHSLLQCRACGMKLKFISRKMYGSEEKDDLFKLLKKEAGDFTLVPEGGYAPEGARGAALIQETIKSQKATHVCTSVGTATTLAGLLLNTEINQQIIAVPAIKNMTDIAARIAYLNGKRSIEQLTIWGEYHFGGYAKFNTALINFMNAFYSDHYIPTDFIYTAKLMYAVMDRIEKNYFDPESHILCLHTGGLQGNLSLPQGTLIF